MVVRSFNDTLISDRRVTGRIHDSRATSCEWPAGSQSICVLYHILVSSKPTRMGQSDLPLTSEQLYNPLNMLGSIYRSINRSLVDAEKLLELLNQPTDVNDKPGALDLLVTDGEIKFGMCYCSFPSSQVDSIRW